MTQMWCCFPSPHPLDNQLLLSEIVEKLLKLLDYS